MRSREKSRLRSQEICKALSKCGAKFVTFARSPVNGASVVINRVGNDYIRLWVSHTAKISYAINKRFKQAVITIDDPQRIMTRIETLSYYREQETSIEDFTKDVIHNIHTQQITGNPFRYWNGIIDLNGKVIDYKDDKALIKAIGLVNYGHGFRVKIKYTGTFQRTIQTFLVGIDESAHFVSVLKDNPKSVAGAHKSLRPKGIPNTAKRIGEFFFVQAKKTDQKEIQVQFEKNKDKSSWLETDSSHYASSAVKFNKQLYIKGFVKDNNKGRHKPVYFDQWQKVVRNTEKPQGNSRSYD